MKRWIRCGLMMLATIAVATDFHAQCVMCKAVAEDSAADGSLGRGLNSGILYLMAVPYVLMAFFAWVVFRKRKEASHPDVGGAQHP